MVAPCGEVEPGGHHQPAGQRYTQSRSAESQLALDHLPAGQVAARGEGLPGGQKKPGSQDPEHVEVARPASAPYRPPGQGCWVAEDEADGQ